MTVVRVAGAAIAFTVGLLIGFGGCAAPGESPGPLNGPGDPVDLGTPGEPLATHDNVEFYPACGNETLAFDGKVWFPFTPEDPAGFPTDPLEEASDATADALGLAGGAGPIGAVVPPGPGDDVGTLVIYESDLAYWESDSSALSTWLTTSEIEYNWVC